VRHCRERGIGCRQTLLHGFAIYNPSYIPLVRSSVRCIHNDEVLLIFTKIQRYGEVLVILALGWGCKEKRKKQRHVVTAALVVLALPAILSVQKSTIYTRNFIS